MSSSLLKSTSANFGRRKTPMTNYKLRKTTIFKNAKELSILCGVDVALIMYANGNANPEVWCSEPDSIDKVINRAYGKTIVPPNPAANVDRNLGVNGLNEFARLLAGKIEQVDERINQLKTVDGLRHDLPCQGTTVDDDCNNKAIGFCKGGADDDKLDEAKTSDYGLEWFNQLVTYNGNLDSLSKI